MNEAQRKASTAVARSVRSWHQEGQAYAWLQNPQWTSEHNAHYQLAELLCDSLGLDFNAIANKELAADDALRRMP